MKLLYGVPETGNHQFATYYTYHKDKLRIKELTYDPCFLYNSGLLTIVRMHTNDTLMLANNNFARYKKVAIKFAKIMTKDREYLTSLQPLKFHRSQIMFDLEGIVLTKKSHVGKIFLVRNYDADATSSRKITRINISTKEQYLAHMANSAYIASMCQPETFFDLF